MLELGTLTVVHRPGSLGSDLLADTTHFNDERI